MLRGNSSIRVSGDMHPAGSETRLQQFRGTITQNFEGTLKLVNFHGYVLMYKEIKIHRQLLN